MLSSDATATRCFRVILVAVLCVTALPPSAASAQGSPQNIAQSGGAVTLSLPVQGGYDFHDTTPASPAQRLRNAPLPDPNTVPRPDTSLHDPATGADTSAFGSAYTYPNPNNDTTSAQSVGEAASKSAGLPVRTGGLVVFEWGYPPPPMPKVPGDDLTAAPPPLRVIDFAIQADDQPVLDAKSLWIVQRAVQAYGRANLTEITIERPADRPGCCTGTASLIRDELIRQGLGPDPRHLLPGHRIRLVLAALPASR